MYRRVYFEEALAEARRSRSAAKSEKQLALEKQLCDSISKLSTIAENLVPGDFIADTHDHEDHTFCGIMFNVECQTLMPIQFIEIQSVAVRGNLGMLSVYTTRNDEASLLTRLSPDAWQRCFGPRELEPSQDAYVELKLDLPIRLAPGQIAGIYIHSERPDDSAIVYDDYRGGGSTFEDPFMKIHPGYAHTSNIPFSRINFWGGTSWRSNRQFVGRVRYGIKYFLWTPLVHYRFPGDFQANVRTLLCCHSVLGKKGGLTLGRLPQDVLWRIINSLPHDWFLSDDMKPRTLGSLLEDEVDEDDEDDEGDQFEDDDDDDDDENDDDFVEDDEVDEDDLDYDELEEDVDDE